VYISNSLTALNNMWKKSSAIAEMAAEHCIRQNLDSLGYIFVADSMGHFLFILFQSKRVKRPH